MFTLTEEHEMLREAARSFAQDKMPTPALRALRDSKVADGFDRKTWAEMAEMGWAGILVPEDHGGSGFGIRGAGLIAEELGKTLAASPFISTAVVGVSTLLLGGSDAQKDAYLPKIAAGELLMALAVDEGAHHAPSKIATKAATSGTGYTLTGTKKYVIDGQSADVFIVAARTSGGVADTNGITLFLVPADADGVSVTKLTTMDSRGAADVRFDAVSVRNESVLGSVDGGYLLLDDILDRARVVQAAEMLGSAEAAFAMTLDYLKVRTQFGQLIGSFQSLQHRAARMFSELELTRSCVGAALAGLEERANDIKVLASLAKARAGDTLHLVSNETVQMHGGIGMTDVHDSGLFLKRARVAEALYGSASFHRDRFATLSGF